jgi:hypothetical protein
MSAYALVDHKIWPLAVIAAVGLTLSFFRDPRATAIVLALLLFRDPLSHVIDRAGVVRIRIGWFTTILKAKTRKSIRKDRHTE